MSISLVATLFQVSFNTDYMGYTEEHVAANEYGASGLSDNAGLGTVPTQSFQHATTKNLTFIMTQGIEKKEISTYGDTGYRL